MLNALGGAEGARVSPAVDPEPAGRPQEDGGPVETPPGGPSPTAPGSEFCRLLDLLRRPKNPLNRPEVERRMDPALFDDKGEEDRLFPFAGLGFPFEAETAGVADEGGG